MEVEDLVSQILNGNKRALARAITLIENQSAGSHYILEKIFSKTGKAHVIGFTGPPGSGKSTLVDKIIGEYRNRRMTVGVIAVDPSSPFTGGAILGDRIRMLQFTHDDSVFIRSMSSRGKLGGLSNAVFSCIALLDAFGFDKILVETVGAGQSEVDIVQNSDTTLVLTVPGTGDDIQVIKAGIMEIANVFVINKADLPGAEILEKQIISMLDLVPSSAPWKPPIIQTISVNDIGIIDTVNEIEKHWQFLKSSNELKSQRKKRLSNEVRYWLNEILLEEIRLDGEESILKKEMDKIFEEEITPYNAAMNIFKELTNKNTRDD